MKAFDGLISRLDLGKETIIVLEDESVEASQNKNAKYKGEKRNTEQNIQEL